MASIKKDPISGNYRIHFRYGGKQFQKSLKTCDEVEAKALLGRIELMLRELGNGRKVVRPGADFWEYVFSDGTRTQKADAPVTTTLEQLFMRYEQEMPEGAMEENSLKTHRFHSQHLLRILGQRTPVQTIDLSEMQRYVTKRSREKYRGGPISPRTIKKEVARFRAVWNWGKDHGIVIGDAPTKKLRYEKGEQAIAFQTMDKIKQRLKSGGLSEAEIKRQWASLFLGKGEIGACLEHVKAVETAPFVYPMFVFVAYTGARRSEMIRSQVGDFDFADNSVIIREKKKDRTVKETQRRVKMTEFLALVMKDWLGRHPGGPYTFCHGDVVERSKNRSRTTGHQSGKRRATTVDGRAETVQERTDRPVPGPLSLSTATHFFKEALAGSVWEVVRGFHVYRHSFASNLAAAGIDSDVINAWMGHQTEDMRRRYRHLFPEEVNNKIQAAFE
jgi:integrase